MPMIAPVVNPFQLCAVRCQGQGIHGDSGWPTVVVWVRKRNLVFPCCFVQATPTTYHLVVFQIKAICLKLPNDFRSVSVRKDKSTSQQLGATVERDVENA